MGSLKKKFFVICMDPGYGFDGIQRNIRYRLYSKVECGLESQLQLNCIIQFTNFS